MKDNKIGLYILGCIIINIVLIGCATTEFNFQEIDFSYGNINRKLFKLNYYDRSNINIEQAEKIMEKTMEFDGDSWGYYYMHYGINKSEENIFNLGPLGDQMIVFLNVLGIPKSRINYNISVSIYLFDSNGNITGIFENTSLIKKYKGFYYGYRIPKKKIAEEYKTILEKITNDINNSHNRINTLFELSGKIEDKNISKIYTKIYQIIK